MSNQPSRRQFLQATTAAAAAAALGPSACVTPETSTERVDNIYAKLKIRPVINGVGTVTSLGGSIMPPEVIQAMVDASKHFIHLAELQRKAGQHIAELIGVPAAMISCGAASAITVATAACVTNGDTEKLRKLPDTSEMKNEVIQQKAHRSGYQAQMWLVGAKIVWVETREELEKAFNERTAMTFYLNYADRDGQISRQDWIQMAKAQGVPTFNDAAADVPPPERLHSYVEEGFDLVAFSGGKGLLGPQATGLLLGRSDLIEAAQKAISPNGGIGRGMKVGKEEIMGLVAAVERYLKLDHAAERRELDSRAALVMEALEKTEGVQTEKLVPEIANHVPHVLVKWDESQRGFTSEDAVRMLREGDPPIAVSRTDPGVLRISMWMLRSGEDAVVAERLRQMFS
jgi:L-seryl-tRNA(Ser) seleniumtransferase